MPPNPPPWLARLNIVAFRQLSESFATYIIIVSHYEMLNLSQKKTYALREVHMDAMIINKNALHFEICLLAVSLVFKFNEGILQAVASSLVSNNFTRQNLSEAAED
jgi:hypothetical protein